MGLLLKGALKLGTHVLQKSIPKEAIDKLDNMTKSWSPEGIVEKSEFLYNYTVKQNYNAIVNEYEVFNNNQKKYVIKKQLLGVGKPQLKLMDTSGRECGKIVKKFHKDERYTLFIQGTNYGIIKRNEFSVNDKFLLPFNGWYLESQAMSSKYRVFDHNKTMVIRIERAVTGELTETFIVSFNDPRNEVLAILMLMVSELSKTMN